MSQLATNCANYKIKPILNTSAPSGTFAANRYLIPFQLYTFNNNGSGVNPEAINGSSGPGAPQDGQIGIISDFTLQAGSTAGDSTYNYVGNNSAASFINSFTVQWIQNVADAAGGVEEWRIIMNASDNEGINGSGAIRGVTILFRFGNGSEYGTVFPLYISQNTQANNPLLSNSCTPSW